MSTSTGRPAGRPAAFSRDTAIDRAMHLFWHHGYLPVTARDLARAMGIQRSSFYNSFGSKEAVFEAALSRYAHLAPDAALELVGDRDPVIPAIIAMLGELCRVRAADEAGRGCLVCNCVAELVGVDEALGPMLDAAVARRLTVMQRLFSRAAARGEFTPRAPTDDIARSFVSFLLGVNLISKTVRSESELWSICRTFLVGIGVDESMLG